ncbi:hypothetical protein [Yoonia sp.]|uniref:hypothetical protein n=1 Tax=Yoonia sp. TaxID=2212373 RepID=UPI003975EF5C
MNEFARRHDAHQCADEEYKSTRAILVIGDLARWQAQGRPTTAFDRCSFTEFGDFDDDMLHRIQPEFIFSPLIGADFDAIEVAERLQELRFAGRYRVITEDMPNTNMVRAEVHAHAPDIDFDLLIVPPITNDV